MEVKHKRNIFSIVWVALAVVVIGGLFLSIFKLYEQAEKAQKIAFTGKVLIAGKSITDSINEKINSEYLADTSTVMSVQRTVVAVEGRPYALIAETIADYHGSMVILSRDTTYFDRDTLESKDNKKNKNVLIVDTTINNYTVYTDSIISKINRDSITLCIRKILLDNKLDINFDYCIYNLPSDTFCLPSMYRHANIWNEGYVFALTTNSNKVCTHYLILTFPEQRSYFMRNMRQILIPIIGLIILIAILIVIMILLISQQRRNQEVKNNFINNMTHEFKTPLATISLACEALSDESIHTDPDTRKAYVDIIKDENDRLQKMVNNILQLARLRKGQLTLNKEEIDTHELLQNISKNISLQINSNGGQLITHYNAENHVIFADKSHIENIFVNIIENALKYTPSKPVIEITTYNQKNMFVVSIQDNGIGISKKNLKHIFDEFFRVPQGNVHNTKGYGLGLNYVKKIVDLHGGRIEVKSELRQGSTFTIYLPEK